MTASRVCIFFREPQTDRWLRGDHVWRSGIRRVIRGPGAVGGVKSVYLNLLKGLDRIGAHYVTNIPYADILAGDRVGVIGVGANCLDGYDKANPILAGVAVAEHPAAWPTLFEDHPVARYVVHSDWVKTMYERHYGPRVAKWAVGIDSDHWRPAAGKSVDFLVYDKVQWDIDRVHRAMVDPILRELTQRGLSFEMIRYGTYKPRDYQEALSRARAMLFLCEHETQGLAYQQALSCDVPVLAWDPGAWLDPWRYRYGEGHVPATSVPYFDGRCGMTFSALPQFRDALAPFLDRLRRGGFRARDYVLENLTLEASAQKYIELLQSI